LGAFVLTIKLFRPYGALKQTHHPFATILRPFGALTINLSNLISLVSICFHLGAFGLTIKLPNYHTIKLSNFLRKFASHLVRGHCAMSFD